MKVTARLSDGSKFNFEVHIDVDREAFDPRCDVCRASWLYVCKAFETMDRICVVALRGTDTSKCKDPVIIVDDLSPEHIVQEYIKNFSDVVEQAHINNIRVFQGNTYWDIVITGAGEV